MMKTNNMERLLSFRLVWQDVWHNIDNGIDTDFYRSAEGVAKIDFLIDLEHFTIDLNGRETEFIDEIRQLNLDNIDNRYYFDQWKVDGFQWFFKMRSTSTEICSSGCNSYPQEFIELLNQLHTRYKLPYPRIMKNAKEENFPTDNSGTREMSEEERTGIGPISYLGKSR